MRNINKEQFENLKKNGIFVFHSFSCWTCSHHIAEFSKMFEFDSVEVDSDIDYYESIGITITPTTRVYKNNEVVWEMTGMLFDSQIDKMRKLL